MPSIDLPDKFFCAIAVANVVLPARGKPKIQNMMMSKHMRAVVSDVISVKTLSFGANTMILNSKYLCNQRKT